MALDTVASIVHEGSDGGWRSALPLLWPEHVLSKCIGSGTSRKRRFDSDACLQSSRRQSESPDDGNKERPDGHKQ
jgi:hypothetical protein